MLIRSKDTNFVERRPDADLARADPPADQTSKVAAVLFAPPVPSS